MKEDLNKKIVKSFSKYCSRCGGICCSKEINAFTFEIRKWPKVKLEIKNNWQKGKDAKSLPICRFKIGRSCPFLLHEKCRMAPAIRPIDCLSYPVYPSVDDLKNNNEINELVVHKSCPFAYEISNDRVLRRLLFKFWKLNLKKIGRMNIQVWLGGKRNYWLDENVIKIKNVQCTNKY